MCAPSNNYEKHVHPLWKATGPATGLLQSLALQVETGEARFVLPNLTWRVGNAAASAVTNPPPPRPDPPFSQSRLPHVLPLPHAFHLPLPSRSAYHGAAM